MVYILWQLGNSIHICALMGNLIDNNQQMYNY
jgi:hypothetical protein